LEISLRPIFKQTQETKKCTINKHMKNETQKQKEQKKKNKKKIT
jgi:hypothetical protein